MILKLPILQDRAGLIPRFLRSLIALKLQHKGSRETSSRPSKYSSTAGMQEVVSVVTPMQPMLGYTKMESLTQLVSNIKQKT